MKSGYMQNDEISKDISEINNKMTPVLAQADKFEVKTEDDAAQASIFLAKLKQSQDVIEAKRLSFTKPLNQSLKEINGFFKPITDEIQQKRNALGSKIIDWKTAENEKIAKEEARRQAISDKAAEKRGEENTKIIEVERVEKTVGFVTTRKGLRKFKVIDFDRVPDCFKMVNEVELNKFIRDKNNEGKEVPGIKVYQEDILATKGLNG